MRQTAVGRGRRAGWKLLCAILACSLLLSGCSLLDRQEKHRREELESAGLDRAGFVLAGVELNPGDTMELLEQTGWGQWDDYDWDSYQFSTPVEQMEESDPSMWLFHQDYPGTIMSADFQIPEDAAGLLIRDCPIRGLYLSDSIFEEQGPVALWSLGKINCRTTPEEVAQMLPLQMGERGGEGTASLQLYLSFGDLYISWGSSGSTTILLTFSFGKDREWLS